MVVFVVAVLLAAVTGWLVETVASGAIDGAVAAFRELIGGWRPDPWPRGVQEEDPDKPWGAGMIETVKPIMQGIVDGGSSVVATAHVNARTHAR